MLYINPYIWSRKWQPTPGFLPRESHRWRSLAGCSQVVTKASDMTEQLNKNNSACLWNLKKWYWWTYLKGSNQDTDMDNGLGDTAGEGESGMNGENSINIHPLVCAKQTAGRSCYRNREPSLVLRDDPEGREEGREAEEGGDICIITAELRCCMAETNTTL